jgi:hypothetical protein
MQDMYLFELMNDIRDLKYIKELNKNNQIDFLNLFLFDKLLIFLFYHNQQTIERSSFEKLMNDDDENLIRVINDQSILDMMLMNSILL